MQTHENYSIKILTECSDVLESYCQDTHIEKIRNKRKYKNTTTYYLRMGYERLALLKLCCYNKDVPYFIKAIDVSRGAGTCWVLNKEYIFTTGYGSNNAEAIIDWFKQSDRLKVYKLLKITG